MHCIFKNTKEHQAPFIEKKPARGASCIKCKSTENEFCRLNGSCRIYRWHPEDLQNLQND
jgi:hypothetical protein